MKRVCIITVTVISMTLFPAMVFGQSAKQNQDSIKYNHFIKIDLFGPVYQAVRTPAPVPRYLSWSVQYEAFLNRHQTYSLSLDYRDYGDKSEFWVRPVWRYYFKEAFKSFYVGAYPAYVHVNGQTSGDFIGLGAIVGVQTFVTKRICIEFNFRNSWQFGSTMLYDASTGQYHNGSYRFALGAFEVNLGYALSQRK